MPRGPRVDAPGAVHHVMIRGIERRRIFYDSEDYEDFLTRLDRLVPELGFVVYTWVLMPNHAHVLLRHLDGRNHLLSGDLGRLKRFTGTRINAVLGNDGSFWQDENFDHWCRTPEEFDRVRHYVLQNPVRAGLVRSADEWPWRLERDK